MKKTALKIKKGDNVVVLVGKDRGKHGKVEKVFATDGKILIEGINQYKKHVKRQNDRPGEVVTLNRAIGVSKAALICPKCKVSTRIGYQIDGKNKYRICLKCKALID